MFELNQSNTSLWWNGPNLARFGPLEFLCTTRRSHESKIGMVPFHVLEHMMVCFWDPCANLSLRWSPAPVEKSSENYVCVPPVIFIKWEIVLLLIRMWLKICAHSRNSKTSLKMWKSPLKFTDSSIMFFHKFKISKPSARIEMDALINHKQSHLSKLLEHQSVQLILGCRCREEKIIEGHSSVHFELFLELESADVFL